MVAFPSTARTISAMRRSGGRYGHSCRLHGCRPLTTGFWCGGNDCCAHCVAARLSVVVTVASVYGVSRLQRPRAQSGRALPLLVRRLQSLCRKRAETAVRRTGLRQPEAIHQRVLISRAGRDFGPAIPADNPLFGPLQIVDHEVSDEILGVLSACRVGNFMINVEIGPAAAGRFCELSGQPARKDSRTSRVGLSTLRSTRQIRCQVPRAGRPPSTGIEA
jgi:hypothetical protein